MVATACGGDSGEATVQSTTPSAMSVTTEVPTVSQNGERAPAPGNPEYFTGATTVKPLFDPIPGRASSGGEVTFPAGARTAWHTHPAGQTLVITEGRGWIQHWDGPRRDFAAGDVVWIPAGVKHWHGATAGDQMVHIAIQETVDGSAVTWMEQVTDPQYNG